MTYTIEVRNNNVEKALRVLKKKLMKEGTMKLLKERSVYQKPSERKREKKKKRTRKKKEKEKKRNEKEKEKR